MLVIFIWLLLVSSYQRNDNFIVCTTGTSHSVKSQINVNFQGNEFVKFFNVLLKYNLMNKNYK